ncbi:MAG: UbiA family prenyltransferase [bacterium]
MRVLDHVFFLRPLLLAPAAAMFVMGHHAAAREELSAAGADARADLAPALLAFGALAFALLATHAANQLADEESDRVNGKLPHLALGLVSRGAAKQMVAACLAVACALIALSPATQWLLLAASAALGLAYASPPLVLKRRAGWDLAANAIGYGGLAFAVGWGSAAPVAFLGVILAAAPWMLAVASVFAATTVVDAPGDAAAGARTLAVALGTRRTRQLAIALMAGAAGVAWMIGARTAFFLAAGSIPALVVAAVRPTPRTDHLAFQIAAALPTLVAAIRAPLFGAALVACAVTARLYFRARFGRDYPHVGEPARRDATRAAARLAQRGDPVVEGDQSLGRRTTLADSPGSSR